jgi:hypothetical protein
MTTMSDALAQALRELRELRVQFDALRKDYEALQTKYDLERTQAMLRRLTKSETDRR